MFVTTIDCGALGVVRICGPNISARGATVIDATAGPGDPAPVSTTVTAAGPGTAGSPDVGRNTTDPARVSVFRGENVTGTSHVAPGITVVHAPSAAPKSPSPVTAAVRFSGTSPVFCTFTEDGGADFPTSVDGNTSEAGTTLNRATGVAAVPVPFRPTVTDGPVR